jgi:hypothetical protein
MLWHQYPHISSGSSRLAMPTYPMLSITLDRDNEEPIYRQLIRHIKTQIESIGYVGIANLEEPLEMCGY